MILRPSTRPQPLLRAFTRCNNSSRPQQRRCKHSVPLLGNNNAKGVFFEEHGVPNFLTGKTYRQIWLDYQQHLCEEVNSTVEGLTKYDSKSPHDLHQELAHNPEYASLYNAAAMLHFNHFWWESLATEKKEIPDKLKSSIEEDFNTVEDLRVEMLQHADAMFGNGFVWLMREGQGAFSANRLRIMCTYNAGSPYVGAHQRRQTQDMATADTSAIASRLSGRSPQLRQTQNKVGGFGLHSGSGQHWPDALIAQPLLCLNVWQHAYLHDYGILGKQTYLAAWWESIDWDVVYARARNDPEFLNEGKLHRLSRHGRIG